MARARRAVLLYHSIVAAPERHLRAADHGHKINNRRRAGRPNTPNKHLTSTAVLLPLTRSIGQTTLAEGHLPVREYQLVPAGEH